MKWANLFSRLAFVSLTAAAIVRLTEIYGGSVRPPLPNPRSQALREHRSPAPQVSGFPEFIGEGVIVAIFAVAGRTVFRLRLSPASRSHGRPILLNLQRG